MKMNIIDGEEMRKLDFLCMLLIMFLLSLIGNLVRKFMDLYEQYLPEYELAYLPNQDFIGDADIHQAERRGFYTRSVDA